MDQPDNTEATNSPATTPAGPRDGFKHIRDLLPAVPPSRDRVGEKAAALAAVPPEQAARENQRRQRFNALLGQIGERYRSVTFDNFRLHGTEEEQASQARTLDRLREFHRNLTPHIQEGRNLILYGPAGTGKDHLVAAMSLYAAAAGHTVLWYTGPDLYGQARDRMQPGRTTSESDLLWVLRNRDVLVISDPSTPGKPLTDWQTEWLYRIVDGRYRAKRPTWVTLNVHTGHQAEELLGLPTVDRLRHGATAIQCAWRSFRTAEDEL